jgi:hypothetical protein
MSKAKVTQAKPKALVDLFTDYDKLRCVMTTLRSKVSDGGIDYSEFTRCKLTRKGGFRKIDPNQIRIALRDRFGEQCSHEHDCCGCICGGPGRIEVKRGAVLFTTYYTRNV